MISGKRFLRIARMSTAVFIAALFGALLCVASGAALVGCTQATPDGNGSASAQASRNFSSSDEASSADVTQRAMVAYVDDDHLLLVDTETETPYFVTNDVDDIYGMDGREIDEAELAIGNIVEVVGDGIMLESYPGQYPGIRSLRVVEAGSPSDAAKYADLVNEVIVSSDAAQIPTGHLDYASSYGNTTVILVPLQDSWDDSHHGDTGNHFDAGCYDEYGNLTDKVIDVRIDAETEATLGFDLKPTRLQIERKPLTNSYQLDLRADDMDVPLHMENGVATFTMEPGYLYEVEAEFSKGEVDYAFYTIR